MITVLNSLKTLTVVAVVMAFLGLAVLPVYKAYFTDETVTVLVNEKITKRGVKEDKYLIFTDSEVFENTDSLLRWKFNSSDVYAALPNGKTCTLLVNGWRIPFLSMYRNVLEANCG